MSLLPAHLSDPAALTDDAARVELYRHALAKAATYADAAERARRAVDQEDRAAIARLWVEVAHAAAAGGGPS